MIEIRACSACGGRVDVMVVPEEIDQGHAGRIRVGACERCGTVFNEKADADLPSRPPTDDHDRR